MNIDKIIENLLKDNLDVNPMLYIDDKLIEKEGKIFLI